MAKKKQAKKHKFKYSDPVSAVGGASLVKASQAGEIRAPQSRQAGVAQVRDFSYVTSDMRRVLVLAASLVLLECLLYYLMNHTSLGPTLNRLLHT
jgi:hypothetical protein